VKPVPFAYLYATCRHCQRRFLVPLSGDKRFCDTCVRGGARERQAKLDKALHRLRLAR
jgi:hypothetical protein